MVKDLSGTLRICMSLDGHNQSQTLTLELQKREEVLDDFILLVDNK